MGIENVIYPVYFGGPQDLDCLKGFIGLSVWWCSGLRCLITSGYLAGSVRGKDMGGVRRNTCTDFVILSPVKRCFWHISFSCGKKPHRKVCVIFCALYRLSCLYWFPKGTITSYYSLMAYNNRNVFSHILKARNLESGCWGHWFLRVTLTRKSFHSSLLASGGH